MFSLAAKEAEECSTYVGQTKRALKTRFKEHLFKIKPFPLGFIDNINHEGNIS